MSIFIYLILNFGSASFRLWVGDLVTWLDETLLFFCFLLFFFWHCPSLLPSNLSLRLFILYSLRHYEWLVSQIYIERCEWLYVSYYEVWCPSTSANIFSWLDFSYPVVKLKVVLVIISIRKGRTERDKLSPRVNVLRQSRN